MSEPAYSTAQFEEDATALFEEYYSARPAEIGMRMARFHLAIEIYLSEFNLSGDDIADQVLQDSGDQGVDFFYVTDDDEPRIFAIQVKDHVSFAKQQQVDAISKLVDEIKFLVNRQRIDNSWDERRRERYADIRAAKQRDFTISYSLIMTGGPSPIAMKSDFSEDRFEPGVETLDVLGIAGLVELQIENFAPVTPRVHLSLPDEKWIDVIGPIGHRTVVMYVSAAEYINRTRPHGSRIFRLNPRLFLGKANKSNKKMLETLRSSTMRQRFHLYNNGITAVCRELSLEGDQLVSDDFQVVNGCQTTETLWKASTEPDVKLNDVLVPLRIIETGENTELANKISETTNSQTAITSADLVANSVRQQSISEALLTTYRPMFYEARRGSWNQVRPFERERFRVAPGEWGVRPVRSVRHLKLKELAQALLAVCASPNAAKEQISSLFSNTGPDSHYSKIVEQSWSDPSQIRLVAELYKYVSSKDNWIKRDFPTDDESRSYSTIAGLGRFYITYLIYKQWRDEQGEPFDPQNEDPRLISPEKSSVILNDFLTHVNKKPNLAVKSLIAVKTSKSLETRPLLRQATHKSDIEAKYAAFIAALEELDQD